LFKITELLARGISWQPIVRILASGMPAALIFSIPISVLTACLLVFGRLSADGEISAMRVSGISIWHIASRPLVLSLLFSATCLYIGNDLAPRSHFARRKLIATLGVQSPLDLIEEGRYIEDFPGLTVRVGRRHGNSLENIRIYDSRTEGLQREIRAKSGFVKVGAKGRDLILDLYDVRVDPVSAEQLVPATCARWTTTIEDALARREPQKRDSDLTAAELVERFRKTAIYDVGFDAEELARRRMSYLVTFNKRIVLGLACVAFVFLGIPLGIKAHRKESSVGIAISLGLVFSFYLFIIAAESLARRPELRPDLIIWIPFILAISVGAILLRRSD